jgi:hypothetical protein
VASEKLQAKNSLWLFYFFRGGEPGSHKRALAVVEQGRQE